MTHFIDVRSLYILYHDTAFLTQLEMPQESCYDTGTKACSLNCVKVLDPALRILYLANFFFVFSEDLGSNPSL